MIVADYDADGATACAVGVRGLRALGADVDFIVPNRFEFGYGLTPEIVDARRAARARICIVTVDNGIASVDGVRRGRGARHRRADHRPPPARPGAAGARDHRQSEPARLRVSEQAHRGRRRDVLRAVRDARAAARSRARSRRGPSRISRRCSTSWRSAPSPTSCASTRPTASSSSRGSRACGRARRTRACSRCSPWRAATRGARRRTIWASSRARGSMPPGRLADMTIGIRCLLVRHGRRGDGRSRARSTR